MSDVEKLISDLRDAAAQGGEYQSVRDACLKPAGYLEWNQWLLAIGRAAQIRCGLTFGQRVNFDNELCPIVESGLRIAYPDAIWHITQADVERAEAAINGH